MSWLQYYRIRHYVRNAIWIYPVATMALAMLSVRCLHWLDNWMGWQSNLNPDNARMVLSALAGAIFTFIVFVCSSMLLVVQLSSAQLTPRVIGTILSDSVVKLTLAVFVFTFTFSLAALLRIDTTVPLLITEVAAYSCLVSIGLFLYLIDHIGRLLRPSGVFKSVAYQAHQVIERVYPRRLSDVGASIIEPRDLASKGPAAMVTSTKGGVVLAFDEVGLVALATPYDCVIELVPQVGDFIAPGDPLFRIYGGQAGPLVKRLRQSIAIGAERTIEQDPAFAFRLIVDIASKGLSPAINDPTTAVLAIDRIHHLLRHVGSRRLDNEKVRDAKGQVRLFYRTPDWEDFVMLAVTEIRHFGASSVQIARRLRAMLEDLIRTLPDERAEPLRQELRLLKKSSERFFQDPEDRARADVSDAQGMGGAD